MLLPGGGIEVNESPEEAHIDQAHRWFRYECHVWAVRILLDRSKP